MKKNYSSSLYWFLGSLGLYFIAFFVIGGERSWLGLVKVFVIALVCHIPTGITLKYLLPAIYKKTPVNNPEN